MHRKTAGETPALHGIAGMTPLHLHPLPGPAH